MCYYFLENNLCRLFVPRQRPKNFLVILYQGTEKKTEQLGRGDHGLPHEP